MILHSDSNIYPSNLTKYGVLNLNIDKTTNIGHKNLGEVAFGLSKAADPFYLYPLVKNQETFY